MRDSRQEILHFWFEETDPALRFHVNPEFDALIRDRFRMNYTMARDGLCEDWRKDAEGALALCLLLDQFPRNMYRNTPEAFATDEKALLTAKYAVSKGFDLLFAPERRYFLYRPFQHSEKLQDQRRNVELCEKMAREHPWAIEQARKKLAIIEKFDRFPQRNSILGRENTPEEQEYLAAQGPEF